MPAAIDMLNTSRKKTSHSSESHSPQGTASLVGPHSHHPSGMDELVSELSHDLSANFMVLESSFGHLKQHCHNRKIVDLTTETAHLEACLQQSKRLLKDLATLAKTGSIQMKPSRIEISEVLQQVVQQQAESLLQQGIQVRFDRNLPTVWCHQTRIHQVFTNLISNAIKHGCAPSAGMISISSRLNEQASPGWTTLTVHDNGPGIPQESRQDIFLPGRQLHPEDEQGSGVGLAIVSNIVEYYGGTIYVDPQCHNGTAIVLTLPLAPADPV